MSLASQIPKRTIDQKAETIAELMSATGQGEHWMQRYANDQVAAGLWERVFKRGPRGIVPAYRASNKRKA